MNGRLSCVCPSILVLAILLLTLPSCMTVSDTKNVVPNTTSGKEFTSKRLAVLPVKTQTSLAPDSVMPLRVELNKRLGPALSAKLPAASVLDISEVTNELNQRGALSDLEQLFATYENTGVLNKKHTASLGHALKSHYLLLSRLKAEKMDLAFISKGIGASLELMIVNAETGQVSWSGNGEWKRGGMLGAGNVTSAQAAENLVKLAFASLQSGGETAAPTNEKVVVAPATATVEPPKTPKTEPTQKSESFSVGDVQKRLLELGYKPGAADGKMGPGTIRALKKFQQDNRLPVTGQTDKETIAKLFQKKS